MAPPKSSDSVHDGGQPKHAGKARTEKAGAEAKEQQGGRKPEHGEAKKGGTETPARSACFVKIISVVLSVVADDRGGGFETVELPVTTLKMTT